MTGTVLGVVLEVMAATVLIGGRAYARRARARVDKYGGWVGARNYFSIAMLDSRSRSLASSASASSDTAMNKIRRNPVTKQAG
jgi:hypothetical protein